jgi:hypothetical protein
LTRSAVAAQPVDRPDLSAGKKDVEDICSHGLVLLVEAVGGGLHRGASVNKPVTDFGQAVDRGVEILQVVVRAFPSTSDSCDSVL